MVPGIAEEWYDGKRPVSYIKSACDIFSIFNTDAVMHLVCMYLHTLLGLSVPENPIVSGSKSVTAVRE